MAVRLTRVALTLLVALVITVVVVVLLTPLGFETRPTSDLKSFGYAAIAVIFLGLALYLTSIAVLFRRGRSASWFAIAASILLSVPVVGDQFGYFFSVPMPAPIRVLEYVLAAAILFDIVLAGLVLKERGSDPRSRWAG